VLEVEKVGSRMDTGCEPRRGALLFPCPALTHIRTFWVGCWIKLDKKSAVMYVTNVAPIAANSVPPPSVASSTVDMPRVALNLLFAFAAILVRIVLLKAPPVLKALRNNMMMMYDVCDCKGRGAECAKWNWLCLKMGENKERWMDGEKAPRRRRRRCFACSCFSACWGKRYAKKNAFFLLRCDGWEV